MTARARRRLRIAMALYGDITYDSRVLREAATLCDAGHAVSVFCLSGQAPAGVPFDIVTWTPAGSAVLPDGSSPFLRASMSSRTRRLAERVQWLVGYARTLRTWGRWAVGVARDVDVWHVHDLTGLLAVAPIVRSPARLVYDSHEIFLETGSGTRLPGPLRRVLAAYEGHLARRAIAMITVNEGYAQVLRERLRPRRLIVVRNCAPRWLPAPELRHWLRELTGVPSSQPLILYHGGFSSGRGIEQLLEALVHPDLAFVHLVLMGYGPDRALLEMRAREERFEGRVHVLDPVPPHELVEWIAGADIDVIPLQRSTLNHWLCTPNKLWESLAAGVPVVVSNFPMMRHVVLEDPDGPLGEICEPSVPASIASAVQAILNVDATERNELRARCRRAAHERWSWETESARMVALYDEVASDA